MSRLTEELNELEKMGKEKPLACPVERGVSCDGSCHAHDGEVRKVHVVNEETGNDWGEFNYCEFAIKQDRENGFKVEVSS